MNYSKIVKNTKKYHYLYVYNKKCIVLSSNNELSIAKDSALNKIKSKLKVFQNNTIIRFKIKLIKKSIYENSKNNKLSGIGGRIAIDINLYKVSPKGNLKMDDNEDRNTTIYLTDKYLSNVKTITTDLKKIALYIYYNKPSSILQVRTIDNIL